jgi:predicted tellurium resistance membrane protein TerC
VADRGSDDAVLYTTVYLVERSPSLDNLFVVILLFSYFAVPVALRARLLFWGIALAIVLRGWRYSPESSCSSASTSSSTCSVSRC